MTPLHYAIKNGSIKLIRLLIDHGADIYFNSQFISLCFKYRHFCLQ